MRIGIFTDTYSPDINGVVSSIVTLQEGLIELGHEVFVITTHAKLISTKFENNVLRLPGIEIKKMYGYVLTTPAHFLAFNHVKSMNLDVIHVHTEFGVGIFGHIIGSMLKLPIVSTYHTTYEDYTHYVNIFNSKTIERLAKKTVMKLSRMYGSHCMAIVSPSEKTKEMLLRYQIETPIHVIPTGLNLDKFKARYSEDDKKAFRAKIGISESDYIITYVGRIAKEKSIDVVINGMKELVEINTNVRFLVVGAGPALEELQEQTDKLKLNDHVIFYGKVPNQQVPEIYGLSDMFVSASLTETQGLTFIEALASGLPVFARKDDVLDELVFDQETGFYFADAREFAKNVDAYTKLSVQEKANIENNTQRVVEKFDRLTFAKKVSETYELAMKRYFSTYYVEDIIMRNDISEVELISKFEKSKIKIFPEVVKQFKLKKGSIVNKDTYQRFEGEQKVANAFEKCVRKISFRDRTRKEIFDFLHGLGELDATQMNAIISKLESYGYIDDVRYTTSMIMNFQSLLVGQKKIVKSLLDKGIPYEMILKVMKDEGKQSEFDIALMFAEKIKSSLSDMPLMAKKSKIRSRLISRGFEHSLATEVVNQLDYDMDEMEELIICQNEASRIKSKLDKKDMDPYKAHQTLLRQLVSKGFRFETIQQVIDGQKEEDFD
ncbi:MAG: RecX family transcriptional regulator [Erysipelothrix sp.]|nr:RecX family transcriptional regulator [Erysipelothrix sp.]